MGRMVGSTKSGGTTWRIRNGTPFVYFVYSDARPLWLRHFFSLQALANPGGVEPDFRTAMTCTDRDALVALFRSTDGKNWKRKDNWDTNADLSKWEGVHVDNESRVVKLSLGGNYLRGNIPEELGTLTRLEVLWLGFNRLTGSIPEKLGNLTALRRLWLNNNVLEGSIPEELGALTELESLCLENNELTGCIPKELGALHMLKMLFFNNNNLTGTIPRELGNLTALVDLYLHKNGLSGNIPEELGALNILESLRLDHNSLEGPIPKALGALGKLEVLLLESNKLTGCIPEELGTLSKLAKFSLCDNKLTEMGTGDHVERLRQVLLSSNAKLEGNPWELPPAVVVAAGKDSIHRYYRELKRTAKAPVKLQSMKVVVAGHSGDGKSRLLQAICGGGRGAAQTTELKAVSMAASGYHLRRTPGHEIMFYDSAGPTSQGGHHRDVSADGAVYVVTWDASTFLPQTEALMEGLMELLVALHEQAPRCTVIFVGIYSGTTASPLHLTQPARSVLADVEVALKTKLEAWTAKHGVSADEGLTVDEEMILIPSSPEALDDGAADLVERLESYKGTISFIPTSWSLALLVLDALRYRVEPLDALRCWEEGRSLLATSKPTRIWTQKIAFTEAWKEVQNGLPPDRAADDHFLAIESFLQWRQDAGSLLQHGEVLFLDVDELVLHLTPVLNLKTYEQDADGCRMFGGKKLEQAWQHEASRRLIQKGILHRCFARFLWEKPERPFPEATFSVLCKLGVLLPLEADGSEIKTPSNDHECGRTHAPEFSMICGRGFLVLKPWWCGTERDVDEGGQSGEAKLELTEEDNDAVDNILAMVPGVGRDQVIDVFFACEKNAEMAANLLFMDAL